MRGRAALVRLGVAERDEGSRSLEAEDRKDNSVINQEGSDGTRMTHLLMQGIRNSEDFFHRFFLLKLGSEVLIQKSELDSDRSRRAAWTSSSVALPFPLRSSNASVSNLEVCLALAVPRGNGMEHSPRMRGEREEES